jgi:hypothetical protein
MMSHGTFLELLELAAMERGLRATIELLRVGPDEIAKYREEISINKPILRFLVATGLFIGAYHLIGS